MSERSPLFGISQRLPPANLQAEQGVLGALMVNAKNLNLMADFLRKEHFADPIHSRIYAEQVRRITGGGIADAISLKNWWEGDPGFDQVGGFSYLAQLTGAYVGGGTAQPYARVIREAWQRRQLIAVGEEIVTAGFDGSLSPEEVAGTAAGLIDQVIAADAAERPSMSLNEAMDAALHAADEAAQGRGTGGISTGFRSIDERIGGLEKATLNILAARPAMGKTSLGWQMAVAAARAGVGVAAISLEMSAVELGRRALAALSGVPVFVMKRGLMTPRQADALLRARRELNDLPLTIEDGAGLTAAMITMKVRAIRRKHGLGLVMVDHLHIVRPEDADVKSGPTWAVGRVSGAMKRLAKDLDVPVLLLAQLNRGVEGRDDKRPALSDLRQAGDIEQDADTVAFVYRAEYYLSKSEPEQREGEDSHKYQKRIDDWHEKKERVAGAAELIFAKVRDGAPGTVELRFNGETTSFTEVDSGYVG